MLPLRVLLLVTVAVVGCSESKRSGADAGPTVQAAARVSSCDRVPKASVCSEWRVDDRGAARSEGCTRLGGVFVVAECPNTTVIGSCSLPTGEVRKFYSGGAIGYDPTTAAKDCKALSGTWAPLFR